MAEGIMSHLLPEESRNIISVWSAGTNTFDGFPPSELAREVCLSRGIDITNHASRLLTEEIIENSDIILTMERRHLKMVKELGGEGKATLLTEFPDLSRESDIEDPIGRNETEYETVYKKLETEISRIILYLLEKQED
jgi:protein-tyrosine-phosphatase